MIQNKKVQFVMVTVHRLSNHDELYTATKKEPFTENGFPVLLFSHSSAGDLGNKFRPR